MLGYIYLFFFLATFIILNYTCWGCVFENEMKVCVMRHASRATIFLIGQHCNSQRNQAICGIDPFHISSRFADSRHIYFISWWGYFVCFQPRAGERGGGFRGLALSVAVLLAPSTLLGYGIIKKSCGSVINYKVASYLVGG